MSRSPTLSEVINAAVAAGGARLRVSMPGRIESFDAAKQLAVVKPLLKNTFDAEDGTPTVETIPVIHDVPVQFPGGGGFASTWPVSAGDPCLLVFSDRSLDRWISNGGDVDPQTVGRHELSDAVAILGVRSSPGALADFDASRAVVGNKGPRVAFDGSTVHVGVGNGEVAGQSMIRGDAYRAAEDQLLTQLQTAMTTIGVSLTAVTPLMAVAAALNAIPIVGGVLALAPFGAVAASIAAAGAAATSFIPAVPTFSAQAFTYKTDKAKVP